MLAFINFAPARSIYNLNVMDILSLIKDIVLLILSFGLMHFVSERYFIESLDHISRRLKLSSDMAGSTLMAAGSSAPELAVALFAIFMSGHHEAIGVGTIVGSALFNILVITGVVMLYHRKKKKLVWQPILRDILFYILAVFMLAYVFYTGTLSLWAGIILVGTYIIYVAVIYFWKRIANYNDEETETGDVSPEEKVHKLDFLSGFDSYFSKAPFLTFILSIGMISLLSWLLVKSAVGISEALGIPEFLIGITIVAIGTSVPDLISSAIVARQGRHGMAINNAIGSNTFDILIGLGLPFLLYMLIKGDGFALDSNNLVLSVGILFASAVLLLVYFLFSGWKVNKWFGIVLLLLYATYLVYVIIKSI